MNCLIVFQIYRELTKTKMAYQRRQLRFSLGVPAMLSFQILTGIFVVADELLRELGRVFETR